MAYAPVSFMIRSLKNDVVALEYPINYFMSQCIHNGEIPYWFNTWAMGFPLQSNLTWGIFSTPQMVFCSVFKYDIFILHIELMFFVLMAGWGMFYLLKKFFIKDEGIALILACSYMLSGFITGSGQWMLYISAAAFIPFVLSSLIQLLRNPSFKHAMLFAVVYFMMFTSVYAAFNIITTYCLFIFTIWHLLNPGIEKSKRIGQLKYLGLALIITSLFCLPCILSTIELLQYMSRGKPLSANTNFFNSNYLPLSGISSMLLPFSSVKMRLPNTEGTMFNSYAGLFTVLTLPVAIAQTIKEKNRTALAIALVALLFLLISFGSILPVRNALNILPGFSYFRNPGLFRLYFIFFLIIYIAIAFRNFSWKEIFDLNQAVFPRHLRLGFFILLLFCLVALVLHFSDGKNLSFSSLQGLIKNISYPQTVFINALIQIVFLVTIFLFTSIAKYKLAKIFIIGELIVNTLFCTPYFTVSSYSLPEVNNILHSVKGFPVQKQKVNEAAAIYRDEKGNEWANVNIFHKEVSVNESYRGPLVLKNFSKFADDSSVAKKVFDHALLFPGDSTDNKNEIKLILQRPTHIKIEVIATEATSVTVMQNYFPGWKVYYNDKKLELVKNNKPGMSVNIPAGKGTIDFIFSKRSVWVTALLLHLIVICFLFIYIYQIIKGKLRSSFPSLQNQ